MYETGLFGNSHELTERNLEGLENGNPSEQVQPSPTSPTSIPTRPMKIMGRVGEKYSLETLIGG
jgi:hypothetical protein